MKALTIRQPWATLLAAGIKNIETRPMRTHHRGEVAIHAGLYTYDQYRSDVDAMTRDEIEDILAKYDLPPVACLPRGAVLGSRPLEDCGEMLPWAHGHGGQRVRWTSHRVDSVVCWKSDEMTMGEYAPGRFAWRFGEGDMLMEPIPYRGAQGMWTLPEGVLE